MLNTIKKNRYLVLLSLAITLLFANYTLIKQRPILFQNLENIAYDLRVQFTMPNTVDNKVVIIDIDEKSLSLEGRWPWPRDRIAKMIDTLFDHYQIAIIGFDMVFAEEDLDPGITAMENLAREQIQDSDNFIATLEKLKPQINRDQQFANSILNRPVVLGYYFQGEQHLNTGLKTGQLPFPILPVKEAGLEGLPFLSAVGYGANIDLLQDNAMSGGFFDNPSYSSDGVIRSVPMVASFDGNLYESLALATVRTYLDSYFIEPVITTDTSGNPLGLESIKVAGHTIPVNDQGIALVPYLGPQGSFKYYSVSDVLNKSIDIENLQNKIVLLGTTSPGLQDLRNTPVQGIYPGVEVHANLIAGILDSRIKHQPSYSIAIELIQVVAIGLLLTFVLPLLTAARSILLTILVFTGLLFYNLYSWEAGLVLPVASSLILIGLLFTLHMAYGFLTEARMKHRITQTFGQYVPKEVVEELAEHPKSLDLSGQSRELTVLFSDVRGFTTLSEGLSPSELTQVMNAILTPMTRIIHHHNGTIDKYMGDAVMAFWGAPLDDPMHSTHALEAAMEMVDEIAKINQQFAARGWPAIDMGVGLNSGMMNVGNMGSMFRVAYTVLGDAVNLGSRLEGLTKAYGVRIIISEFTAERVQGFLFRELDKVRVKGKEEPVVIYEPVIKADKASESLKQELKNYHSALQAYREQRWQTAQELFEQLISEYPETQLYPLYLQRTLEFQSQSPGENWDGVYTFETK